MKISKILKKVTSFVMVFALMGGIIVGYSPYSKTYADEVSDLQDKIAALQEQNDQLEQQMSQAASDKEQQEAYQQMVYEKLAGEKEILDAINSKIYYKQLEIDAAQGEIDKLSDKISETEVAIGKTEEKISALNEKNADNLEKFAEIVKALYVAGDTNMMAILSGANDFYDLMVRSEVVSNISKQNMDFMDKLLKDIKDTQAMKKQLDTDKTDLEAEKADFEKQRAALETEKENLVADQEASATQAQQYESDYNTYSASISELDDKVNEIQGTLQASQAEIDQFEEDLKAAIIAQTKPDKEYVTGDWAWPVPGRTYISCAFGWDADFARTHKGVDVGDSGISGTSILAAKAGTVIVAENYYIPGYSYGKYVVVDHGGGYTTTYAHCSEIYVGVGQEVAQGEVIAAVGNTGFSTGPHLHFEIRQNGEPVDPLSLVSAY